MMEQEFKTLFEKLTKMPYEAHWFTRIQPEKVLSGCPSDPIWKLYECPVSEYKQLLGGAISHVFGSGIQKIIP